MPRRDGSGNTKDRYLKILEFTHFVEFWSVDRSDPSVWKKELIRKIEVSVAVDLGMGDTKSFISESEY